MAGFAHFFFGLSLGLIFMSASKKRFSNRHLIVFSVNNYLGPDIGTIFWYFFGRSNGTTNLFGFWISQIFHTIYGWPLICVAYAWFWTWFSEWDLKRDTTKRLKVDWIKVPEYKLNYRKSYELCVAGGILHLFLDVLSTLGAKEYEWYINTGTWGGKAYITWFVLIYFIMWLCAYIIIYGILSQALEVKENHKIACSAFIVIVVSSIYAILLLYVQAFLGLPAVGEEADAGVIIFFGTYLFFPLILVLHSFNDDQRIVKIKKGK